MADKQPTEPVLEDSDFLPTEESATTETPDDLDSALTKALDDDAASTAASSDAPAEEPAAEPAEPVAEPAPEAEAEPEPAAEQPELLAPTSWSQADRETFHAMPREAQQFLLDRTTSLETDYTRKRQQESEGLNALGQAEQMVQASLGPQYTAQHIPQVLQKLLAWEVALRGEQKVDAAKQLLRQMGIQPDQLLDVEADPLDLDPAVQQTNERIMRLENQLASQQQAAVAVQQQQQAGMVNQMDGIYNTFRAETDGAGNLLRPHLSKVEKDMTQLVRLNAEAVLADPAGKLQEIYETACWMNSEVRGQLQAAQSRGKPKAQVRKRTTTVSTEGADSADGPGPNATLDDNISHALDKHLH